MRAIAIALTSTFWFSSGYAAPVMSEADTVGACMDSAASGIGFNGIVYARHGDLVVQRPFGTSDALEKVAITPETRFNIGSAGKMFTAVAIARLVDRGAVLLDAPISRYLTDMKPPFADITIAELLNHTSGLGDYFNPENKQVIDAATTATDLLPLALATPPAFAPGTKRAYSNSGYVVLGAIIEKVSAMPYAEYIQRAILDPLGMTHTRMEARDGAEPMTRMSPNDSTFSIRRIVCSRRSVLRCYEFRLRHAKDAQYPLRES